jgi:hypothetical protein
LSSSNATGVLANLSDALGPDAEVELATTKLKYRDISALLDRGWSRFKFEIS